MNQKENAHLTLNMSGLNKEADDKWKKLKYFWVKYAIICLRIIRKKEHKASSSHKPCVYCLSKTSSPLLFYQQQNHWEKLALAGQGEFHQHLISNCFPGNCITVQCGGQNSNITKLKYSQVSQRILRLWSTQIGLIRLIISVKLLFPSTDLL